MKNQANPSARTSMQPAACDFRLLFFCTVALFVCTAGRALAAPAKPDPKAVPVDNPAEQLWKSPDFVKRYMGYDSSLEPRLSGEEQALYKTLDEKKLLTENPKKAIEELQAKITPTSSALLSYSLATIYFREGDQTNAIKHYEVAVAKFPKFMRAHKNLGFALAREGKFPEAAPHLTKVIELGGGDSATYGLLGYSYLNLEKFISAEAAYKNAMLHDPENMDWKLGLIKSLAASSNYRQAAALLDELIQKQPEKESLWILQANMFVQQEETMKAAVNLEFVRKLGKAAPPNLYLLGDIYMSHESKELALSAYLEAVEKDGGKNIPKALRAAEILTSRGATDEAKALFQKIRDSAGANLAGDDEMKLLKLESKVAIGIGEGEKAILTLEQIILKNPLDGEALLLAGDYYGKNGQREKAEFRYQAAANLEAFQVDAWVKHAQLLVQSRKYNEAIEFLKRAQKSKPRDHIQRYLEKVEVAAARSARS
jgi:tetratricopeptide (TPR) repeat protein